MKRTKLLFLGIACICTGTILFSCNKEVTAPAEVKTNSVDSYKIEAASAFNAAIVNKDKEMKLKIPGFVFLAPQWKDAWTVIKSSEEEYLVVPTIEGTVNTKNVTMRRLFLFEMNNKVVNSGQIVEFFGLDYDVNKNLNKLILNEKNEVVKGFNGAIIHYDLNYWWTSGDSFKNGKKDVKNFKLKLKDSKVPKNKDGTITYTFSGS